MKLSKKLRWVLCGILCSILILSLVQWPQEVAAYSPPADATVNFDGRFNQNVIKNPGAEYVWYDSRNDKYMIYDWYIYSGDWQDGVYLNGEDLNYRRSGYSSFCPGEASGGLLYQYIYIGDQAARIDNGELRVEFYGWLRTYDWFFGDGDEAWMALTALRSDGTAIRELYSSEPEDIGNDWKQKGGGPYSIPSGTRYLRVELGGTRYDGSDCDAYFDDLELIVTDVVAPRLLSGDNGLQTNLSSGTYKEGTVMDIILKFTEPVVCNSGANIGLSNGGTAVYSSGSGTNTLTFRYTVQPGHDTSSPLTITRWIQSGYVKDHAGNSFTESRSGKIQNKNIYIDTKTPTVTECTSSNGDGFYKAGDVISIQLKFSENVTVHQAPVLKLNTGRDAVYKSGSGTDTLTFEYTIQAGDNTIKLDVLEIAGGDVQDAAGHATDRDLSKGSTFGSKKNIRIDTQGPAIVSWNHGSDINEYKKTHPISVTVSDNISGIDKIQYQWSTGTTPPDNWSGAPEAMSGANIPVPADATGIYYLHIRALDKVGNSTVGTSTGVYLDNTGPVINFSPDTGSAGGSHTITVTASDAHSGLDKLECQWKNITIEREYGWHTINNGDSTTTPEDADEGEYVLSVRAYDIAGNVSSQDSAVFKVDKTPPTISFSPTGNEEPARQRQVTVQLEESDGMLGPSYYQWTQSVAFPGMDDAGWVLLYNGGSKTYSSTVSTPAGQNGTWYLHVKSSDSFGNTGGNTSSAFFLDNTPPMLSFSPNSEEGGKRSVDVELNITDNYTTDIEDFTIKYLISSNPDEGWDDTSWSTSSSINFQLENKTGVFYIYVKVYDSAGNAATLRSGGFKLDNTGPEGSIDIEKDYTNDTSISVVLTSSDFTPPVEMSFSIDNGEWSDWEEFTTSKVLEIPGTEGEHTVSVKFRDALENESSIYSDSIVYDITPPEVVDVTYSTEEWTNKPVKVTIVLSDNFTPADEIVITNTNNNPFFEFQKNGSFTFEFRDLAGNQGNYYVEVNNIDKEAPSIWFDPDGTSANERKQSVSATINASDNVTSSEEIEMYYQWSQNDTSPSQDWIALAPGDTVEKSEGDGNWYLWVRAVDKVGNERTVRSNRFLLDNTPPVGTITYSTTKRTAQPVTATLHTNEEVIITNPPDGSNEYVFTENGTFEFVFVDLAGNEGRAIAEVNNIDKSLPKADISYSTTYWTNEAVTVTISVVGENPGELFDFVVDGHHELVSSETNEEGLIIQAVYKLHENGSISFKIRDLETGVEGEDVAVVQNIDKTPPHVEEVYYSETSWTNKNVTVTITVKDDCSSVTFLNPEGNTYVFTENGEYTFRFRDEAGNIEEKTIKIDYIDKEAPNPEIKYSSKDRVENEEFWTNENVTVTISFPNESEPVTILNNNGSNTYVFSNNGSFTFQFVDVAGNEGSCQVVISKIDRTPPGGRLEYSTLTWTNQDVVVTLIAEDDSCEPVIVLNDEVDKENNTYIFTENGSFTFRFRDAAGNTSTLTAQVDRIDKEPPVLKVMYSNVVVDDGNETLIPTNTMVKASVSANEPVTLLNDGGGSVYQESNGDTFIFVARDRAGNESSIMAVARGIDRTPPVPYIEYSPNLGPGETTRGNVVAIVGADEEFYVLNNGRKKEYVFTENGSFTFLIQDLAGNTAEITAEVNCIDKSRAKISLNYSTTEPTRDNVTVLIEADRPLTILNNEGSNEVVFEQNGVKWIEVEDTMGNKYTIKIEVTNIDREAPSIKFFEGEDLILERNQEVDYLADVEAVDNIDGDVLSRVNVQSNVNVDVEGSYSVTYSVSDTAGNVTTVTRRAIVVSPGRFRVYINSKEDASDEIIVYGSGISVKLIGAMGETKVRYAEGKQVSRYFKENDAILLKNNYLEVTGSGYYTLHVQDQERQTRLIYVYIVYEQQ
ncbi:MAG: DUF5011 domain-containing protein [Clostridiaceae bacterium]|nr:DUF5011 domain-containing protein [Clostridiaceae bacterium]